MPIEIPELPGEPERDPAPTPPPPAGSRRSAEPREARPRITEIPSERWYGVYPALVIDHRDPEQRGRVKVTLPWVPDAGGISGIEKGREYEGWARLATLAAGPDRGSWFLPDVDDEVLVSFEAGIPSRPVVVGALWNGKDTPPVVADEGNTVKLLRTRGGSEIRFHDQEGEETVEIRTAGGQSVRLANAQGGTVQISDSHGNSVALGAKGIVLDSAAGIQLNASTIALSAGSVSIDAGMVTSSGVVKCDTLITNAVVANSYTPGAGNIW